MPRPVQHPKLADRAALTPRISDLGVIRTLVAQQLRQATEEEQWAVDLQGFNDRCQDATKAATAGQYESALKSYVYAMSFMMNELRSQGRRQQDLAGPDATES